MQSGKWHLSGHGFQPGTSPYDRGFSNAFTLLEDGSNHFSSAEYVPGWSVTFVANDTKVARPGNGTVFSNTLYADKLLEFFNKTHSENKPFFAYLAFQVAHTPAMCDFLLISTGFSSDIIAYFLASLLIFLIFLVLTSSLWPSYNSFLVNT